SHIKFAKTPADMKATRIAMGEADALIGCDLVVAAGDDALSKLQLDSATAVTDTTVVPTSEFSKNPDWQLDGDEQFERLTRMLGDRAQGIDAQGLASVLMGDAIFANMLLVGAAWQQGGVPLSLEALHRAIELNGVKIDENKRAFDLGRLAVADPDGVQKMLPGTNAPMLIDAHRPTSLDDVIADRTARLTEYSNAAFAKSYTATVSRVRKAVDAAGLDNALADAVARGLYKLMAVKDEWEVARLYTRPEFRKSLAETFEGTPELTFYFGAWPYGGIDPKTGQARKGAVKGKMAMRMFGLLNRLRGLRGTFADPFRNSVEAKLGRHLLDLYEEDIDFALANLSSNKSELLTELLDLPTKIRGYGHVRQESVKTLKPRREALKAEIAGKSAQAA
ncbi:MAG: DUF6537 domain-containing protein, partial [Pikeienuella sp.]